MLSAQFEDVTPEMAAQYLKANTSNRTILESDVSYLAGAMERGEWETTHQGVAFFDDGALADGQHRLKGIVESGTCQRILVVRGIARSAMKAIDMGRRRSMADKLKMLHTGNASDISTPSAVSIINPLFPNKKKMTYEQVVDIYESIEDGLRFVDQNFKQTAKVSVAAVRAAFLCAYYAVPHSEHAGLKRLMAILSGSEYITCDEERAAAALKEFLVNHTGSTHSENKLKHEKTQEGIRDFLRGMKIMSYEKRKSKGEIYPYPVCGATIA